MPPLTEAQKKAYRTYCEKSLKKMTFTFNMNTDADIISLLDNSESMFGLSKHQLLKTAVREYAEQHKNQS